MRHLLVTLCALFTFALAVPAIAVAQDATPAADVARTDIRYLVPFGPDGLNSGLTVGTEAEGVCGFSSSALLDRPDAWDCISADNEIFDACLEMPMMAPDELGQVACFDSPFSTEVTLLTLTEPLVRQKAAPDGSSTDPSMGMNQITADEMIAEWDLPWALELANGDQCTLLGGTLTVIAGQTVHYGCINGGMVIGETNHDSPVWTVNYLADGDFASNVVDVVAAWT